MSVTYLTTPIVETRHEEPTRGAGMTRDGYTKRSGAPTSTMVRLQGEKRWRRLMVWQFSNMGTMFVRLQGVPHVVREEDLPREGASPERHHATMKKTATAKYPYIAYWVHTRGLGGRKSEPVYVLGTCRRADEGIVGDDLRIRPLRLGKGTYTAVVAADDVEDRP